jgi:catechol 2,3-dioxygenase-like lactoylglutathione lyase family enzyme
MLHHSSFAVADLARAAAFFDAIMVTLGYRRVCEADAFVGHGTVDEADGYRIEAVICGSQ